VETLWVIFVEVPEHSIVGHIGLRVTFVPAIHGWKLDRVPDEENRKVVKNKVLNAFFGIKLCCPAPNVANGITGPLFPSNSGHAGEDFCLFSNSSEELGVCEVGDVVKYFKFAESSRSFRVYASARAWSVFVFQI
jgi:hypothetical protein